MIRTVIAAIAVVALGLAPAAAQDSDALGGLFGGSSKSSSQTPSFGGFGQDAPKVSFAAEASQTTVAPGGTFVIAATLTHIDGFHSWPSADQDVLPDGFDFAVRTEASLSWDDAVPFETRATQWPEPHAALVADPNGGSAPVEVMAYDGAATIFLPVVVAEDASAGSYGVSVSVLYQACDDKVCLIPEQVDETITIEVAAGAEQAVLAGVFEGFDEATFSAEPSPEQASPNSEPATQAGSRTFFGFDLGGGFLVVLLAAGLGGFILNLTPCVLPVIPIKVMTITHHAGTPGKALLLGIWTAVGVTSFWIALGIPVALVSGFGDPSRVFGLWWFSGGLGLFMAVMSLGLMGLFTIALPQAVYKVNPKADSLHGSFLFGVMTAVFGLPCFGFVIGPLLGGSATQPPLQVLGIFGALGAGMALPYLVLSAKPSWVERIPRTGPASELVKQVMGLLMFGAGAFFLGAGLLTLVAERPYVGSLLHFWAVVFFVSLASIWLVYRTFQISRKPLPRVVFSLIGVALIGGSIWFVAGETAIARAAFDEKQAALEAAEADGGGVLLTTVWNDYSPALHEQALEEGYTVVLDFTASWCVNCKALKAAVLNKEPVKGTLRADDIVTFTVDLSSTKAPGWDLLSELGQTGIPLLVVERDGGGRWMSNAYTSGDVLSAIEDVQGEQTASR
ncbi:MAG: thioredoxin family protein [Planctomycetota bacterium]